MIFKLPSNLKILLLLLFFLIQNSVTLHHISYSSCLDTDVLSDHYSSAASTWSKVKSLLQSRTLLACSSVHVQMCMCAGGESNIILWLSANWVSWDGGREMSLEKVGTKKQKQKQNTL